VIWAGYRSVDTFFLVGGLLVSRALLTRNFCIVPKRLKNGPAQQDHQNTNESGKSEKLTDNQNIKTNDEEIEMVNITTSGQHWSNGGGVGSRSSIIDTDAWNEVKSQDFLITCVTFLTNYSLYIVNRIVR